MKKLLLILTFLFTCNLQAEENALRFVIVPDQDRDDLLALWQPVVKQINKATDLNLKLEIPTTMADFEHDMAQQKFDVAYANPIQYVQQQQHYIPIMRAKQKNMVILLLGNQHHKIKTLKDFDQQTLFFTDKNASFIPLHELNKHHVTINPRYVKNQETLYRTIAMGLYDYTAGDQYSFEKLRPSLQDKLTILWESPAYTGHGLLLKKDLTEIQKTLTDALLTWQKTHKGKRHLKRLHLENIIPAKASDWDDIRAIMPKK